ncbi:MAG TPA: hypothetical protein DIW43_01930, partial [Spongiibacteraceae bacterium]|nr:hypothetical protein [Spongiibacteraceae bacterium]
VSHAQLGGLLGGGGAAPAAAPDLSCTSRGADGKLSCGDIGLEETADFCDDVDSDYVCDDKDECPDTPEGMPVFMNGCHEMELSADRPWVLRGVNFEFDRAVLRQESIPVLDAAVNVLNEHPELLVAIDGHTDNKGSESYNERLSRQRAEAVQDYFVDKNVNPDRLVFRGFGEARPIAPNSFDDGSDNPEGRFENRRVELNVLDLETFNAVKSEIAERKAQREAEAARRSAARAKAAAAKAEAEAEEAEKANKAAEKKEKTKESSDEDSVDEFDASEYLKDIDSDDTSDSDAAGEADSKDSADAEEQESSSGEFDESEYLDFLEGGSSNTEESEGQ